MHHAVEISLPRARIDLARRGAWSAAIRHAPRVLGGAVATNRRAQLIKETFWRGVTLTPAYVSAAGSLFCCVMPLMCVKVAELKSSWMRE